MFRILAEKLRLLSKPLQMHMGSGSNPHCVSCAMSMNCRYCRASRLCCKSHMDNPSHHRLLKYTVSYRLRMCVAVVGIPRGSDVACLRQRNACLSVVSEEFVMRTECDLVCQLNVKSGSVVPFFVCVAC